MERGGWVTGDGAGAHAATAAVACISAALDTLVDVPLHGLDREAVGQQTPVIVRAVTALPSSVDTATLREAEAHLVEQAGVFDPVDLARLGRHVLEVVAAEEADRLLGEALGREEARANRRHLTLRPDEHGGTRSAGAWTQRPPRCWTPLSSHSRSHGPRTRTARTRAPAASGRPTR